LTLCAYHLMPVRFHVESYNSPVSRNGVFPLVHNLQTSLTIIRVAHGGMMNDTGVGVNASASLHHVVPDEVPVH
jgi:hypothetical protein